MPGVPVGACTETASAHEVLRIWEGNGVPRNDISIVEPMNQVNSCFVAVQIPGGSDLTGQAQLDCRIREYKGKGRAYHPAAIQQTIICFQHEAKSHKLAIHLQTLLPIIRRYRPVPHVRWNFDPSSRRKWFVAVYHAHFAHTMEQYAHKDCRNGITQMLVARSARAMGIDDPFVQA